MLKTACENIVLNLIQVWKKTYDSQLGLTSPVPQQNFKVNAS